MKNKEYKMQVNRLQNNNLAFGIKVSDKFIKAADMLYCDRPNKNQAAFNKVYRKAKYMEEHYGYDDYTIVLREEKRKNKLMSVLYAVKDDNSNEVLLAMKDGLNKLMEKFTHINEYELKNTMNGSFTLKPWKQ